MRPVLHHLSSNRLTRACLLLAAVGVVLNTVGCRLSGGSDLTDRFSAADGNGRIVAEGRPPLTFMYPGQGRVVLRDLDSREIIYSMESPLNPGPQNAALLVIDEERRALVARETVDGKIVDTPLVGIDPRHRYRMIYLPQER